jgi:hypothetical protein
MKRPVGQPQGMGAEHSKEETPRKTCYRLLANTIVDSVNHQDDEGDKVHKQSGTVSHLDSAEDHTLHKVALGGDEKDQHGDSHQGRAGHQ